MINWTNINDLLIISKMEELLNRWFGVELIFADVHGKVRSLHLAKDYHYKNHFMKIQMHMGYGYEYLQQDIEKSTDYFQSKSESSVVFDSFFPHINFISSPVSSEGEYLGQVMVYPYYMDDVSKEEVDATIAKMIECGATEEDAKSSVEHLRRLASRDVEYLKELVEIVSEEISTFHSEISVREQRIKELNSELGDKYRFHNMIGKSKSMQKIYALLERISSSESSVLIQGENGTGKELVAKAIHFSSDRKDRMFLAVNCSAFNDNLLDSELFGHVKGAFTGAIKDKKGLFENSNGGTLFLDEIGDTSLSMQVKLLRVLQEGTYLPVGADGPKKCDVRVICATNKNLKDMMAKGEFREDLYYRINVFNVQLPNLRDRAEDISLLIDHFMQKRCAEVGQPVKHISTKCMEKMLDYPWPGNVRELENEIERLIVLVGTEKNITPDMLSQRILDHGIAEVGSNMHGINTNGSLKAALEELEALMIKEGLKRCSFNKSKLSKELGISRASLIMKVEKYGLDKRVKKAANE